MLTRRDFVRDSALLSATAAGLGAATDAPWFDKPMRWAQLVLAENDPGNGQYDPRFWIDFFRRTHCDAANLSAGGCVCFYPTRIPFHHRSNWMKDRKTAKRRRCNCLLTGAARQCGKRAGGSR